MSPSLVDIAYRTVRAAFAPATKTTYAAGILRFNEFCDLWNVDEEARMPASPTLLAAFVGLVRGRYAGGTVRPWLAGIRAWHITHQAEWHGDHEWVQNARVFSTVPLIFLIPFMWLSGQWPLPPFSAVVVWVCLCHTILILYSHLC